MSKKEVSVSVHVILGKHANKFFHYFNKRDFIFRLPFVFYISFMTFKTMMLWCFLADNDNDPFLNSEKNENDFTS